MAPKRAKIAPNQAKIAPNRRARCCADSNCEECRRKRAVKAIEADNVRAKNCQGEHDPPSVVQLRLTNPELHREGYSGKDAVVERIHAGPIDVHCPLCDLVYSHYAVKWIGSERNYGDGPGITIIGTNQLDSNDVREFETEKREREERRYEALLSGRVTENIDLVGRVADLEEFAANPDRMAKKIIFELQQQEGEGEEEQRGLEEEEEEEQRGLEEEEEEEQESGLMEEEGEGQQASTSSIAGKKRKKKTKRSRGGKGFRDWLEKQRELEASGLEEGLNAGGDGDETEDTVSVTSSTAKKGMMNWALFRIKQEKERKKKK
ncbi:hypothetical protein niasHT_013204 [Heterodera trifolii]|uniref:Uncharacterized protein n=1 Tax=Heterodera trifolii TaxID=157864 RepID=A0ABD2KX72_9BILA